MNKVVFFENTPAQSKSIWDFLRTEPMGFEFQVAEKKPTYVSTIQLLWPDVDLCPDSLPWISIYEAENLIAKASRAIPFILLTDTLTETTAGEVIKVGADDCIYIEHRERLPIAIMNVVEKYRHQGSGQVFLRQVQHKIRRSCEEAEMLSAKLQRVTNAVKMPLGSKTWIPERWRWHRNPLPLWV